MSKVGRYVGRRIEGMKGEKKKGRKRRTKEGREGGYS